jgi:hypothetical protein
MFMSAKLDRLAVGSILKQEIEVFLNQCSIDADENPYRPSAVTYLVVGVRREFPTANGRWMGIDNESDQV